MPKKKTITKRDYQLEIRILKEQYMAGEIDVLYFMSKVFLVLDEMPEEKGA